jgi:hypothetical protein
MVGKWWKITNDEDNPMYAILDDTDDAVLLDPSQGVGVCQDSVLTMTIMLNKQLNKKGN